MCATIAWTGNSNPACRQDGDYLGGNEPGEDATISYRQLHEQVSRFANVLKDPRS